jgi:hypothetical protein
MRLHSVFLLSLAALLTSSPLKCQEQTQAAALQGAWKVVRTSLTASEQPSFVDYSQPGLLLFTARHYSLMYVEGNKTRQMFRDPARPTEAEKLDAFDTFVGHSGSYSVADSIIAMQIDISKSPNLMGTELRNTFARFAYQLVGDTLRLTRRNPRGAFTMQLVRAK